MPGIVQVLGDAVGRARELAAGLIAAREAAEGLSNVQAPGTFGAPSPRALPGPFAPIIGADGSAIGGRRTSTSSSGGSGDAGSGGGVGRGFTAPDMLGNLAGTASMPREWVVSHCVPIKIRVPLRTGSASIAGDIGNYKEVDAWQCPAPWGTFLEPRDFPKMSATSTGSRQGHPGGSASTARPLYGRGISNSVLDIRNTNLIDQGPTDYSKPGSSQGSGLQSGGQGLSAPGVESRLDRLIENQERSIRGDGGTGLRAGGLI